MAYMDDRKRQGYKRRIRAVIVDKKMPVMSNRRMSILLDHILRVRGDGLTEPDLRTIVALTLRGLFDDRQKPSAP